MADKDILIFMSDQHTPYISGWESGLVDTPNLDKLCMDGTRFDEVYTACPLCVPARMAMMSGLRAQKTGIFTNFDSFPNTQPSIFHPLVEVGYETVLCGRMHFVGIDQRHGFTRRIAADTTPVGWSRPVERLRAERGEFVTTYGAPGSTKFVGGGESPVVNYDKMVIQAVIDYLSEPHEKPQCIVVGTYGPHFPYVAPKELFLKYMERAKIPEMFRERPEYMNPILEKQCNRDVSDEKVRGAIAAYCGLVELMDAQIGQVREKFNDFTRRSGREGIFCYLSDHGDQLGDRGIFGKDNFFEKSSKIPMIFAGSNIVARQVRKEAASILDMGPTLWELLQSETLPEYDGISLLPALRGEVTDLERIVACEHLHKQGKEYVYGLMLKQKNYKYISYNGLNEMLFDTKKDPLECNNILSLHPKLVKHFRQFAVKLKSPEKIEQEQLLHEQKIRWFRTWEATAGLDESERWKDNPPDARTKPEICIEW